MKKLYIYLLLTSAYCLFCNMTCDQNDEESVAKLVAIETENYDFATLNLTPVSTQTAKETYALGIKSYCNIYLLHTIDGITTYELAEENVLSAYNTPLSLFYANKNLDIITIYDFDNEHKAGSSVTDCFKKTYIPNNRDLDIALVFSKFPKPGLHAFKVIFYQPENTDTIAIKEIEATTKTIELL